MRILSVASEIHPIIKTGGLADVVGALPGALAAHGVKMVTLVPGYPAVLAALEGVRTIATLPDIAPDARLLGGRVGDLDLFVIEAPALYERAGNPYLDASGQDWPDNALRFAALARVAAAIGTDLVPAFRPHVIHCHDWQAALVPAYFHYHRLPGPPVVLTIHNLAFQGVFPSDVLGSIDLPHDAMSVDGMEYYGDISFLKAGIRFADRVTTVSPTYAREIATDQGGMGLGGLLRMRSDSLAGILNGIDTNIWDPAADLFIAHRYDEKRLRQKPQNKKALRQELGLADDPAPLFGVVSRLTEQKGLDLLVEILPRLCEQGLQFAILGLGDAAIQSGFVHAEKAFPGRVACVLGYDEGLAHRIQAGADALLVPSRFEPCGLTQLCAMRYGTVPLVARTGGLADTVIDANVAALRAGVATGFVLDSMDPMALAKTIERAADIFAQPKQWAKLQRNGMVIDFGWSEPAKDYVAMYRSLISGVSKKKKI